MEKKFIDLEFNKWYKFFFSGKDWYRNGVIGKVASINNHKYLDSDEQSSRTFFVTTPNPKSIHDFGIYYWDHGYNPATIYKEGDEILPIPYKLIDGIYCAIELDIKTNEEYFDYIMGE